MIENTALFIMITPVSGPVACVPVWKGQTLSSGTTHGDVLFYTLVDPNFSALEYPPQDCGTCLVLHDCGSTQSCSLNSGPSHRCGLAFPW